MVVDGGDRLTPPTPTHTLCLSLTQRFTVLVAGRHQVALLERWMGAQNPTVVARTLLSRSSSNGVISPLEGSTSSPPVPVPLATPSMPTTLLLIHQWLCQCPMLPSTGGTRHSHSSGGPIETCRRIMPCLACHALPRVFKPLPKEKIEVENPFAHKRHALRCQCLLTPKRTPTIDQLCQNGDQNGDRQESNME